jgi:uncharacterized protein YjiS (DUF1127 family)
MFMLISAKALPRLISRVASAFSICRSCIADMTRRRQTYASLSALDDRTLKDIGLNRSMLMGIAVCRINSARDVEPMLLAEAPYADRRPTALAWLAGAVADAGERLEWDRPESLKVSLGPEQIKELRAVQ